MTGNETLSARFLQENSFDFRPQFKIYINTNYLPVGNDMALFFEDNLVEDKAAEVLTSTVYARHTSWCQENGCFPEGMKNLKQELHSPRSSANVRRTAARKRPCCWGTGCSRSSTLRRFSTEHDPHLQMLTRAVSPTASICAKHSCRPPRERLWSSPKVPTRIALSGRWNTIFNCRVRHL